MDDWVLWLIAAVILGAGEVMTTSFFLAPFAAGAGAAAVASAAGAGLGICLALALVVSLVLLFALRPLARAHKRTPPQIRTGTARLVGAQALVLETVTQDGGGSVKLDGESWSAQSFVPGEVFTPGARVNVIEIRGATALVTD